MTNRIKVLPARTTKRISNTAVFNDIRTKKKEPHIVLEILNDYCSSSTLHGINYLGAKDKRPAEKIWWVIMFILILTACAYLIGAVLDSKVEENCDCLPSCSNLQYTAEISQTEVHQYEQIMARGYLDDRTPEIIKQLREAVLVSQVDIYFKESQFFALQRSELYGQTDFLANCGGLLGLFMGFSLLSLLEIIYFLTIRLWFKYQIIRIQHKM